MESQKCQRLRAGFEMIDSVSGHWLVLDAITGYLVGVLGRAVELELRDEEGAVFTVSGVSCELVIEMARAYLEALRENVRVYVEDSLKKPPTRALKLRCEPCYEGS